MRVVVLILAVAVLLVDSGGRVKPWRTVAPAAAKEVTASSTSNARVDFDTQVKPILHSKCMPCHFNGGQMYERLPFDRPETIKKLGTRLFTRIRDKEQQQLIEQFLTQEK